MKRETIFSKDRKYRYTLWRDWSEQMKDGTHFTEDPHLDYYPGKRETYVQFIGLNPSTADEKNDDPTVRRCIDFAKRWGFGAMCMTNAFAYRATDPKVMLAQADPVGPDNNVHLVNVAKEAGLVVACWGNNIDGVTMPIACLGPTPVCMVIGADMRINKIQLHHLGLTGLGHPKHPLYLKKTTIPTPWT
ncbi:MAG TPA: DUF1643 domain-containing protein [Candidatus Binatia bacterium]|nr:DUF1643 domain-containing protein [Candidatus Binatia bacterium]